MIDIDKLVVDMRRQQVVLNIKEHDTVHELAKGIWIPEDNFILPEPDGDEREAAWLRAKRQTVSIGTRILRSKKQAVLGGGINWGKVDDRTDEALRALNLEQLATGLLENAVIDGIIAAYAHETEVETEDGEMVGSGEFKISRIGNYVQPYLSPMNVDEVTGLFQAWSSFNHDTRATLDQQEASRSSHQYDSTASGKLRYFVRVYDFEDQCIKIWRNLRKPTDLAGVAHQVIEDAPPIRYHIYERTDDGLPLGEMLQSAPTLMNHYALQLLRTLSGEISALPMLVTKGEAEITGVGPAQAVSLEADGSAEWLSTADNLKEINDLLERAESRLRNDLSLSGGFLGNDSPSGEALKEANVKFIQNTQMYAESISQVLTKCVNDYAELSGAFSEPVEIAVLPSKEHQKDENINLILMVYEKNLIPLSVAATELQPYFPTWTDEDLNTWIESQTAVVNPSDFENLLGES